MRITTFLCLAVLLAVSDAGAQICNGDLSSTTTGGSTSSCPTLKETWIKTVTGNVSCNEPGFHGSQTWAVPGATNVTLEATGACNGTAVTCDYGAPDDGYISTNSNGSQITWTWFNGVVPQGGGCLHSDQTAYRIYANLGPCTAGYCCQGQSKCESVSNPSGFWNSSDCACQQTPLLVTLGGAWAQALTGAANGAPFKPSPAGQALMTSWPKQGQRYAAWLVRDRNGNGTIDDASELYGNATPQFVEPGVQRHGFTALASEDANSDGEITSADSAYAEMALWFDANHDGVTDRNELQSLEAVGIISLSLRYHTFGGRDGAGNTFIFESPGVRQVGRVLQAIRVYDVLIRTSWTKSDSQ